MVSSRKYNYQFELFQASKSERSKRLKPMRFTDLKKMMYGTFIPSQKFD